MVVTCPRCGSVSRDPEFCDRCNAELAPASRLQPPAVCPLPDGPLHLTAEQQGQLSRPEGSVTVGAPGRLRRLHWIASPNWPTWHEQVQERLVRPAPCLPPCRVVPDREGTWVVAEATGVRPEPWREAAGLKPLEQLHRLADALDGFRDALETLHAAGLVWLTFDPLDVELADGRLRFTNLDLAVYPIGQCPARLGITPAFAPPEVCRFRGPDLGPPTDVYHLALYAYYWLARYLPHGFFGEGLDAFDFVLPPLRVFAPGLPPGLAGVLERGLATDPARRFASVAELVGAFRTALERVERRWQAHTPVSWEVGVHTRTGASKTVLGLANEDSVFWRRFPSPERALVVVADGISTCDVGSGAIASQTACAAVEAALGPDVHADTFPQKMAAAFLQGARALLDWAVQRGQQQRLLAGQHLMGTTLTAAWLEGNLLSLANSGDSRAYLIDETGAEQLTVDGDLGSALLAAGAPPEEVQQLGNLARALHDCIGGCYRTPTGDLAVEEDRCRPALSRWPLLPGDVLVLCTDGLVEEGVFLNPSELAELVRRYRNLPAAALAEKLADAADARQRLPSGEEPEGFGDNVSCAVIKIS
jgi:serine/threonine protein phosphatase PrpC